MLRAVKTRKAWIPVWISRRAAVASVAKDVASAAIDNYWAYRSRKDARDDCGNGTPVRVRISVTVEEIDDV